MLNEYKTEKRQFGKTVLYVIYNKLITMHEY